MNTDISECCMMAEELLYKIPIYTATLKDHMDQDNEGNTTEKCSIHSDANSKSERRILDSEGNIIFIFHIETTCTK